MTVTKTNAAEEEGILYIMTTVLPGLIKIGRCGIDNYEQRMYNLEHNGYCNITALSREFAIIVTNYKAKENMLKAVFERIRIGDTELYHIDLNRAKQLLTSFDGRVIYPEGETKEEIFDVATESVIAAKIPDGKYHLQQQKTADNQQVNATVIIRDGQWILQKGSILGVNEGKGGISKKAKKVRVDLQLDEFGELQSDYNLGNCSPSHAGQVVLNQSSNGWQDWKDKYNRSLEYYRSSDDEQG